MMGRTKGIAFQNHTGRNNTKIKALDLSYTKQGSQDTPLHKPQSRLSKPPKCPNMPFLSEGEVVTCTNPRKNKTEHRTRIPNVIFLLDMS